MSRVKNVLAVLCTVLLVGALGACKKEGPAERAGRNIDDTVEKAGKKIDRTTEKAADKIEDAGKKLKESTGK